MIDRRNRIYGCLLFLWLPMLVFAQDMVPVKRIDAPLLCATELRDYTSSFDLMEVQDVMPLLFKGIQTDTIIDPYNTLAPLFLRIAQKKEVVRMVHIGDSHVRGHIFPYTVRTLLENAFGADAAYPKEVTYGTNGLAEPTGKSGILYDIIGVNGATTNRFTREDMIQRVTERHPDLILLSFGTNEAHDRRYHRSMHTLQLSNLIYLLRQANPGVVFLVTTPPGSYLRRRWRKIPNVRTEVVSQNIVAFCNQNKLAYWDLYAIVGGRRYACKNWVKGDYMRRDRIHFTPEGYKVQGALLYEALIKAYNDDVSN